MTRAEVPATIYYKLTDEHNQTYNHTQWGPGVRHEATGSLNGPLCSASWIHVYAHPLLAALLNPIHARFETPRCWEVQIDGETKTDQGLKLGARGVTMIREIPLPVVTLEQRIRFAIYCAMAVYRDPHYIVWARGWLDGKDCARAAEAAARAARAAEAAVEADEAVGKAWAAEAAARAARAAEAAARAAWAAEVAARAARAAEAAARAAEAAVEADGAVGKAWAAEAAARAARAAVEAARAAEAVGKAWADEAAARAARAAEAAVEADEAVDFNLLALARQAMEGQP